MADTYNGTLIRFGNSLEYEIPVYLMEYDSYDAQIEQVDTDDKRTANGATLIRNVIGEKAHCKVTIRALPEPIVSELMETLNSAVSTQDNREAKERAVHVKFWIPRMAKYHECTCYVPTVSIKIKHIEEQRIVNVLPQPRQSIFEFKQDTIRSSKMIYDQFDLEFIEY